MQRQILLPAAGCLFGFFVQAQTLPLGSPLAEYGFESPPPIEIDSGPPPEALRDWQAWTVLNRDECSTTREFRYFSTNSVTGAVTPKVASVVEVGNSLNYFDTSGPIGEWRESQELIQLTGSGGAAALYGPHKLYCSADLSSDAAITLVTRSNRVVLTHPQSIRYFDPGSGQSFELAKVNPFAAAELLPPNQIVWRNAFDSELVKADFRLTYSKLGVEADVIYTRRIKAPEACSSLLDPDRTQLQVRHVFFNAGLPRITKRDLGPYLQDEILDFGDLVFPTGIAFPAKATTSRDPSEPANMNPSWSPEDEESIPVGKSWTMEKDSAVLTESVTWKRIAPKFNELPEMANAGSGTESTERLAKANGAPNSRREILVASAPYPSTGVVVDYQIVSSGQSYTFYTFTGNNTYIVDSAATFDSATFQSGCVIKFARATYLQVTGPITCSQTGSPSILTCKDDPLFGETTYPGFTGCPSYGAAFGIWVSNPAYNNVLNNLRIRWAYRGARFTAFACAPYYQTIQNCVFESCMTGAQADTCPLYISSSTVRDVLTPTLGSNCTITGSFTTQVPLATHIINNLIALTNNHNPTEATLFPTYTSEHGPLPDIAQGYNPNCWIYQYPGLAAFSPSNYFTYPGTNLYYQDPSQCAITLIETRGSDGSQSRRYAIGAYHMVKETSIPPTGHRWFTFVGATGTIYVKKLQGLHHITRNGIDTDVAVLLLEENPAMESSVHSVKLLPNSAINKLPALRNTSPNACLPGHVPMIATGQTSATWAVDLDRFTTGNRPLADYIDSRFYQSSFYLPAWAGTVQGGDGGHPYYLPIQGELVLATHAWFTDSGPNYSELAADINSAIDALHQTYGGPDEDVETMSLDAFSDL